MPYRSESEKPFLSDEWCHYIECVGQKFTGGVAESREKLKMYAVAIGFKYALHRNYWVVIMITGTSNPDSWGVIRITEW